MAKRKARIVCDKCFMTKKMEAQNKFLAMNDRLSYSWSVYGYASGDGLIHGKCCLDCPFELEHLMAEGGMY